MHSAILYWIKIDGNVHQWIQYALFFFLKPYCVAIEKNCSTVDQNFFARQPDQSENRFAH